MHHRDEVGRSVLQYSSRSLSKCSSDCISVHVNDVQKIKIKLCVEHYVCVCVCAHLNRCPPLFFLFHLSSLPPQSPSKREEYYFFFVSTSTPHTSGKLFIALFFFFTLAHHQLGWPLVKKQHSGGRETMQMEERTRPGGPRCALCAGESKRKKNRRESSL